MAVYEMEGGPQRSPSPEAAGSKDPTHITATTTTMEARNPWQFFTASYLNPMMRTSVKKALELEDIPDLKPQDRAAQLHKILASRASQSSSDQDEIPDPVRALMSTSGHSFLLGLLLKAVSIALSLYMPLLLRAILIRVTVPDPALAPSVPLVPSSLGGVALCFVLFAVAVANSLVLPAYLQLLRNFEFKLQTALMDAIFRKAFRLSNKALHRYNEGRIIYSLNVDTQTVADAVLALAEVLLLPLEIALILYILYILIGWAVLTAIIFVASICASMVPIGGAFTRSSAAFTAAGDARVKTLREILQGIQAIKTRGLEAHMVEAVERSRRTQLWSVAATMLITFLSIPTATIMPFVSILRFTENAGNTREEAQTGVDAATVFPALSYFALLLDPLETLPASVQIVANAWNSYHRIQALLAAEERTAISGSDPDPFSPIPPTVPSAPASIPAISLRNASFTWSGPSPTKSQTKSAAPQTEPFRLENLSLEIARGELVAVVGPVGSGKSSLLYAMLGDMTLVSGTSHTTRPIAVCHQHPWLLSQTVRDNILFGGGAAAESRLAGVVTACCLDRDVQQLPNGLATQIGERGTTLSGGQKARVGLARAACADAAVCLLDDVLAALDAEVGARVFEECIVRLMAGRTRVVVMHQLQLLNRVDRVVVMGEGRIVEVGTWKELMEKKDGVLKQMMKNYKLDDPDHPLPRTVPLASPSAPAADNEELSVTPTTLLIAAEDRQRGAISYRILRSYFAMSGGWPAIVAGALLFLTMTLGATGKGLWLAWWGDRRFGLNGKAYRDGFVGIGVVHVVATILFALFIFGTGFLASKNLHREALLGIMRAPMSFFDSQPVGRLLNRLSRDMEAVDRELWTTFIMFYFALATLITSVLTLAYTNPYVLILFALLLVVYGFFLYLYRATSRELRRLLAIEKSPLYAHVSESLNGLSSLRAFGAERAAMEKLRGLLDRSNKPLYAQLTVRVWLAVRIQFFSALVILFVSLFGTLTTAFPASIMGLAISTASSLSSEISVFVILAAQLESDLVSVERLLEYCLNLPKEPPQHLPTDPPVEQWPSNGAIQVTDLTVKYASASKPSLEGVTFTVQPGERVGIVGRSGSGKSSLLAALFRLVEPVSGTIAVDGKDIRSLGLHTLRTRMAIVNQDPVVFHGTIRSNLDPSHALPDARLWEVLDIVGLKAFVESKAAKLGHPVHENGANLSAGQRQLLVLARALCLQPKLLVLDEASSAVDAAADEAIQEAVRSHFAGATVLSVAHRINTVAGFDRILVFDGGRLVENGSPAELLGNVGGRFWSLVDATGPANAAMIRDVAMRGKK
ncbi:hypothetical protein HDU96_005227 [Phlyctochytrium bullatum]|nr:hypothetical protein HDU96_005227 [Phlyctochytrium bullatum]